MPGIEHHARPDGTSRSIETQRIGVVIRELVPLSQAPGPENACLRLGPRVSSVLMGASTAVRLFRVDIRYPMACKVMLHTIVPDQDSLQTEGLDCISRTRLQRLDAGISRSFSHPGSRMPLEEANFCIFMNLMLVASSLSFRCPVAIARTRTACGNGSRGLVTAKMRLFNLLLALPLTGVSAASPNFHNDKSKDTTATLIPKQFILEAASVGRLSGRLPALVLQRG